MLSKKVVPIPTTDAFTPLIDVNPLPTFVPVINIGYPACNVLALVLTISPSLFF